MGVDLAGEPLCALAAHRHQERGVVVDALLGRQINAPFDDLEVIGQGPQTTAAEFDQCTR